MAKAAAIIPNEVTEQIVREAPDIEAYKIGLLQSAKALADQGIQIPPQMVAEMAGLQIDAIELARAGIGGYQPYLQEAGYSLGDAQTALGGAMAGAMPFQTEAADLMRTGAANVPGQITATQQGISGALDYGAQGVQTATGGLGTVAENARSIAAQSAADQLGAYGAIPGGISAAQQGMAGAGQAAADVAAAARAGGAGVTGTLADQLGAATTGARTYGAMGLGAADAAAQAGLGARLGAAQTAAGLGGTSDAARLAAQQAATGGIGAYQDALAGSQQAVTGARGITADAARALQQAGALGSSTAQRGIAGLAGTTGAFDPTSTGAFMNQYEDAAVQQALADVARAGQIQQQGVRAQAVGAGAFGGSRQAVAEQELARNVLEQQGRTAAGMRQAGFESAAQRAQQAFEAQQARGQQAAQLTGALGAQGAGTALQAAQAAGQLGLSAEQLAAAQAGQLGQLGMSAEQLAAQTGLCACRPIWSFGPIEAVRATRLRRQQVSSKWLPNSLRHRI
jgi:hypothetical protein